ncbi:GNAT family N-acetyltransferase [Streptomyces sp. NPDC051567]|uniref:GNAT family N-acetyltransferase n=1 Tax=Streptomyces sp. NPDC051567 TaxID=3365660 RepID=UPI00378FCEF6
MIVEGVEMRGVALGDAAGLARAYVRNRAYMAPCEPYRPEAFYTEAGQRDRVGEALAERDAGRTAPYVFVLAATGEPVGAITLSGIVRGPLCSASVGYWVDREWHGRGLASAGVEAVCRIAREELGLHRLAAGTLLDNLASQRVLAKTGFEEYGVAPRYLHVDGAWRDHRLFQRLLHDEPPLP